VVETKNIPLDEAMELWKKDRRDVLNPMMGPNVKEYADIIVKNSTNYFQKKESELEKEKIFSILEFLYPLALSNLQKTIFDNVPLNAADTISSVEEYMNITTAYQLSILKLPWRLPMPARFRRFKVAKKMAQLSDFIAEYCLSSESSGDNFFKKIASPMKNPDESARIHMRLVAFGIIVAGFASVARALTVACLYLSRYPLIWDKIYAEINDKIPDGNITSQNVSLLSYTRAVLLETFRHGNRIPFLFRTAIANHKIDGQYDVKKGDQMIIPLCYLDHMPAYWENSEGFNPDRFLNPLGERYNYVFLPFSIGPRGCLGRHFALMQASIILAIMAKRYRFWLIPNQKINIQRLENISMEFNKI